MIHQRFNRWRRCGWRVLAVLSAFMGAVMAQKSAPVEVRFAGLAAPEKLGKLVMVSEEVRSDAFELPLNFLSEPQEAPARGFHLEREDKPGNLANVALPEEGDAFVILLVPGVDTTFEAVVIPAASDRFRPGDYYVQNVSKKPVMGQVGTTRFVLKARSGQVVRPAGAREGRFYDVALGVREGERNRVISTTRWPLSERVRRYVFFYDNPKRGDVDFRAIDEFVPPKDQDE